LTFKQLEAAIKKKEYAPVYFLHGDESYYIDELINQIENTILDESEKAFNQVSIYGKEADFKSVVDNARQFPMMSERRVVILKEAQEMRTITQLESYFANPSPQTILAIAYKHKKLDKRTKFAKELIKNAVVFESKKLYDNQLPEWIRGRVAELGYTIKPDANRLLCEYLGTNLSKVNNELEKLSINLEKGKAITSELIQDQIGISKDFNVFELQKAIGTKNMPLVVQIFNYFIANPKANPIQLVIASLYQYLSKMMITKSSIGISDDQLKRELRLSSSFFVREYRTAAKNYPMSSIKFMLKKLRNADLQSKGVGYRNMSPKHIYKELAAIICNL